MCVSVSFLPFVYIFLNCLGVCVCGTVHLYTPLSPNRPVANSVVSVDLSNLLSGGLQHNGGPADTQSVRPSLLQQAYVLNTQIHKETLSLSLSTLNTSFILFRPDCVYSCLDARFYDDEMLTVVLCAPEGEEDRGRVLAQLPLGSAHSCQNEFKWDPALRWVCTLENKCCY